MNGVPIPMTKKPSPKFWMFVSQNATFFLPNLNVSKAQKPKPIQTHRHRLLVRYCVDAFARWKWYDHGSGCPNVVRFVLWFVSTPLFLYGAFFFGFLFTPSKMALLIFGWCSFFIKRFHFNIPMKIVDLRTIVKSSSKTRTSKRSPSKKNPSFCFFFDTHPFWVLSPRQHIALSKKPFSLWNSGRVFESGWPRIHSEFGRCTRDRFMFPHFCVDVLITCSLQIKNIYNMMFSLESTSQEKTSTHHLVSILSCHQNFTQGFQVQVLTPWQPLQQLGGDHPKYKENIYDRWVLIVDQLGPLLVHDVLMFFKISIKHVQHLSLFRIFMVPAADSMFGATVRRLRKEVVWSHLDDHSLPLNHTIYSIMLKLYMPCPSAPNTPVRRCLGTQKHLQKGAVSIRDISFIMIYRNNCCIITSS